MSVRQRSPRIPLSPSSPPDTGLKRRRTSETFARLPPSPPHMSVATKSYVSYGHSETASRSSPRSPASASSYTRTASQRDSQPYSTPASSHTGLPGLVMNEDADQHRDKRQRREEDVKDDMELDHSILPTNHDRSEFQESGKPAADADVELRAGQSDAALEQLEKDMGEPFLLCRSSVSQTKPSAHNHMLSMYGLGPLLRTVARLDPDTGEKINKLRKSYEGQIKNFQLSGRNKPVKHEPSRGPSLRESIGSAPWPAPLETDEDWNRDHAKRKITADDEFKTKLRQAMQMQPGKVRDEQKWDDVLGHEKTRPMPTAAANSVSAAGVQRPNGLLRPSNAADAKRTTRGKKRSYGDDSFVGYGDGYSDIEDPNDPDGEDGSDDGGRKKRRKNDSFSAQSLGR